MKEIKFRAWNVAQKIMTYATFWEIRTHQVPAFHTVGHFEFMQYTGLKDKGGKENYHKDILDWDGNRFVVEWDDDSGMWYGKPMAGNKERGVLAGLAFSNTLNIGNVHSNPELLEEAK